MPARRRRPLKPVRNVTYNIIRLRLKKEANSPRTGMDRDQRIRPDRRTVGTVQERCMARVLRARKGTDRNRAACGLEVVFQYL